MDNGEYSARKANQKSVAHKWHNFSVHVCNRVHLNAEPSGARLYMKLDW
jgi:hypothetical protein